MNVLGLTITGGLGYSLGYEHGYLNLKRENSGKTLRKLYEFLYDLLKQYNYETIYIKTTILNRLKHKLYLEKFAVIKLFCSLQRIKLCVVNIREVEKFLYEVKGVKVVDDRFIKWYIENDLIPGEETINTTHANAILVQHFGSYNERNRYIAVNEDKG